MFINELGRHLAVSSVVELEKSLKLDSGFWNVVCIREPSVARPVFLCYAKRFHEAIFEDCETAQSLAPTRPPRSQDLAGILRFVDSCPGEPVLVHCQAGLSRSPAVALALIVRGLLQTETEHSTRIAQLAQQAVEILLQIRPRSRPNMLVLRLGLEQFLPVQTAAQLTAQIVNHPGLIKNRFSTEH